MDASSSNNTDKTANVSDHVTRTKEDITVPTDDNVDKKCLPNSTLENNVRDSSDTVEGTTLKKRECVGDKLTRVCKRETEIVKTPQNKSCDLTNSDDILHKQTVKDVNAHNTLEKIEQQKQEPESAETKCRTQVIDSATSHDSVKEGLMVGQIEVESTTTRMSSEGNIGTHQHSNTVEMVDNSIKETSSEEGRIATTTKFVDTTGGNDRPTKTEIRDKSDDNNITAPSDGEDKDFADTKASGEDRSPSPPRKQTGDIDQQSKTDQLKDFLKWANDTAKTIEKQSNPFVKPTESIPDKSQHPDTYRPEIPNMTGTVNQQKFSNVTPPYDLLSTFPLSHSNIMFDTVFPSTFVNDTSRISGEVKKLTSHLTQLMSSCQLKPYVSGLFVHGLDVIPVNSSDTVRNNAESLYGIMGNDVDVLFVTTNVKAQFNNSGKTKQPMFKVISKFEFPQLVRLSLSKPEFTQPEYRIEMGNIQFLSSLEIISQMQNILKSTTTSQLQFDVNNGEIKITSNGNSFVTAANNMVAIPCIGWPPAATDFADRKRASGWPTLSVINSIKQKGCHIVPCPQAEIQRLLNNSSRDKIYNWKLSFIEAENVLIEKLNSTQRQCLALLALVFKLQMVPKEISLQHLKHHFFWQLEEIPNEYWKPENLSKCFYHILDSLIEALNDENIPDYFIQGSNLLSGFSSDFLNQAAIKTLELRQHPWKLVFNFTKYFRYDHLPLMTDFEDIFTPFVNNDTPVVSVGNSFEIEDALTKNIAQAFISENRMDDGIKFLLKAVERYRKLGFDIKDSNYLHEVAEDVCGNNVDFVIKYYKYLVQHHTDSSSRHSVIGNLGCFYHAAIHKASDEAEKIRLKSLTKDTFNEALSQPKASCATKLDYVQFLYQFGLYDAAIPMLKNILLTEGHNPKSGNSYGILEKATVDEHIQFEIEQHSTFSASSVGLAHYLLIRCYMDLGNSKLAQEQLESFNAHLVVFGGKLTSDVKLYEIATEMTGAKTDVPEEDEVKIPEADSVSEFLGMFN